MTIGTVLFVIFCNNFVMGSDPITPLHTFECHDEGLEQYLQVE